MNTSFSTLGATVSLAGMLLIAGFNSWTSRINQFFFFSRTAPAGFAATPPARRITRTYLLRVWISFVLAVLLWASLLRHSPLSTLGCWVAAMLIQCVLCCWSFAQAHRTAGSAIAESPAQPNGSEPASTAVAVPLLDPSAFTRPLVVLLFSAPATAAVAWLVPQLALHMSFNAFADAIAAVHAEFLTGLGAGLMLGSLLLFVQLRYFARHRSPMARFTARGAVQLAWLGAACSAFSTLCVPMHLVVSRQIRMILLGIVLAIALIRVGYGWARARLFPPPAIERGGDQFWRWGLFYYNPSDPAVFIQHRSGPGYTVNFANKFAWLLPALLLADLVFLASVHLRR